MILTFGKINFNRMKILHVNAFDAKGGAAKAAFRLNDALNKADINSQMLVQFKISDSEKILTEENPMIVFFNKILSKLDALIGRLLYKNINNYSAALFSSFNVIKKINKLNPDIVHLHWTCNGMISIEDIPKIKAPIIWSMHDNWVLSGGCHNLSLCKNHQKGSNKCNKYINLIHYRKTKSFNKKLDIHFLSLSSWLFELSKNSSLIGKRKNYHLPNPIDTKVFSPINKNNSRKFFNLPLNKKILLFGALNTSIDQNKGFDILCQSLSKFDKDLFDIVIFGDNKPISIPFENNLHQLGQILDEKILNMLLNSGDLLVVPSIQENFSNLILEALSASLPVVAFDVGGNKDLITHMSNGYLAKPFNIDDLKKGIEWIINHEDPEILKENARNSVLGNFDSKVVAEKYIDLYKNINSIYNDNP